MLNSELQKETIRQNEDRFRQMIDEIEDYAIFLLSKEGIIQNWNKGAQKLKGYTPDEIVGKSFKIFYTPEDRANKLPEQLLHEAATNGRASHEGWRVRKDGTLFWGSIVITALHDEHRKVIGYTKVTRDMTSLKHSQDQQLEYIEQLRRSEERYHKMIEEVQDYAIILLDPEGIILNWNYGAQQIKGYAPAEVIGKSFRIFYTEEDKKTGLPDKLLKQAADKGRAYQEGYRLRKDGAKFWGSIVITALHDKTGKIIGFSKVTRDLSDKKHAEEKIRQYAAQLEQKNIELEEFSYVASHDLKEPLRKIITFGDLLKHNCKDSVDDKAENYINRMQDAAGRMMSLIEDLLQLSRIGREEQQFEETDLNKVLDSVLQDLEPAIQQKKANISFQDLPTLMAKPVQMQQLFQNLLTNALKFNDKEKPIIHITHTVVNEGLEKEPHCRIFIKDNGIGFEEEHANRIFEAFQRLHGRKEYSGSGIGLAICKKIVELHNGTITATSEYGKGANFIVTLPCKQPERLI